MLSYNIYIFKISRGIMLSYNIYIFKIPISSLQYWHLNDNQALKKCFF